MASPAPGAKVPWLGWMVAVVSLDQLPALSEGPSLFGWLRATALSPQGWGYPGLALSSGPSKVPKPAARGWGFCTRRPWAEPAHSPFGARAPGLCLFMWTEGPAQEAGRRQARGGGLFT